MAPNFELPSIDKIKEAQSQPNPFTEQELAYMAQHHESMVVTEDGVINFNGKPWIPEHGTLRLRCQVVAHSGCAGHRGKQVSKNLLKQHVYWPTMEQDMDQFVEDCVGCIKTSGGTMPRPFGERIFPTKRNQIISIDFMFIEPAVTNGSHEFAYVLVMKDEYSGAIELVPAVKADHTTAVEALAFWCARYGVPDVLRSDGGSHFVNEVIQQLCKILGIHHDITTPYCPFSNGSVERVNRELKRLLQVILRELNLPSDFWPFLLPYAMGVLNSTPSRRLGNHSPRQIFTGLPSTDPFTCLYIRNLKEITEIPMDIETINTAFEILIQSLQDMYVKADFSREAERRYRNRSHIKTHILGKHRRKSANYNERRNHPTNEFDYSDIYSEEEQLKLDASFSRGDLVLVAIPFNNLTSKLQCRWTGPYRVLAMHGPRLALVENLVTKEQSEHHVIHIKFYADKDLDVEQEILDEITWEAEFNHVFEVERILGYKYDPDSQSYMVLVKWKGFSDQQNTYEPLGNINNTAPIIVTEFIKTLDEEQQQLLLQYLSDIRVSGHLQRVNTAKKYQFNIGDAVLVRGSYWKKQSPVPEFYRGVIMENQPRYDRGVAKWKVEFDDGEFLVIENELATSISELIKKQQELPARSEPKVEEPRKSVKHPRSKRRKKI